MTSNFKTLLFTAAVSGLLTGTAVCAHAATAAEGTGAGVNAPIAQTSAASTNLLSTAFHGDKHSCKGKNSCKGKGGCKSGDNGCKGKNSCKGKGGCNTRHPMPS
jgi:hypothetical protein